jgi:release factor glutamine methyltransferase
MNLDEAEKKISQRLIALYETGEAAAISDWVMEFLTGKKRAARMSVRNEGLSEEQLVQYEGIVARLLKHEPVQYVLNESWFMGCRFYVDQRVLIPRPETEELVEWIIANCKFPLDNLSILDVGTGSGCIPISLKRRLRKASVYTLDASADALEVAGRNAASLGTELVFLKLDFLNREEWNQLPMVDLLVSNPPYIPQQQFESLSPHVREFEPGIALFVPDDDALVFYRALAEFGQKKLKKGGQLFAEIHEDLADKMIELLQEYGYKAELKKDMQGKQRMVRAFLT